MISVIRYPTSRKSRAQDMISMHIYSNMFSSNLPTIMVKSQTNHACWERYSLDSQRKGLSSYSGGLPDQLKRLAEIKPLRVVLPSHYWVQWPGRPLATYREQLSPSTYTPSDQLLEASSNNPQQQRSHTTKWFFNYLLNASQIFYQLLLNR